MYPNTLNRISELEKRIAELEQENERLKEKLYDPCTEAKIINDAIEVGFKQGLELAAEIADGGASGVSREIARLIRAEIEK